MKYRFEVIYQNKWVKQASEFLDKCDLGIGDVGVEEVMTFTSKKDLEISELKEIIKKAYQSCECQLLHIEGGKVE